MVLKKAAGNMYDWVTHTHSHLAGECPHKCSYCYVQRNKFGVSPRYKGEPRLIESELNVNYGTDKTIFIEHMNDLFAEGIKNEWVENILNHCNKYSNNTYVFQSKNPERAFYKLYDLFHKNDMNIFKILFGTTIETNRNNMITEAPEPISRYSWMREFKENSIKIFVTIEPIMDFDIDILSEWIVSIKPDFVNIGADSKGCNLPEPSPGKVAKFIDILNTNRISIKKKTNLVRLLER